MKPTTDSTNYISDCSIAVPGSPQSRKFGLEAVGATPCTISVVIAWVNAFELLSAGLDALLTGGRKADEIIVVTRHPKVLRERLRDSYPSVALIAAQADTPITRLRSIGLKRATSLVVAVTEDHCVPAPDWLNTVERRIGEGYDVIGGPVENAWDGRVRDWAAFLTEYAFAIRGRDEIVGLDLNAPIAGNNAAYRRDVVGDLCETLDADLWESFYYDIARQKQIPMVFDSEMVMFHRRPFDFVYFIGQRFHFCRSFAEMRLQSLSSIGRLKFGFGSLILPLLLWLRGLRILLKKKRFVGKFLLCSPLIGIYLFSGAFGEMLGYFFGGGTSLRRVE